MAPVLHIASVHPSICKPTFACLCQQAHTRLGLILCLICRAMLKQPSQIGLGHCAALHSHHSILQQSQPLFACSHHTLSSEINMCYRGICDLMYHRSKVVDTISLLGTRPPHTSGQPCHTACLAIVSGKGGFQQVSKSRERAQYPQAHLLRASHAWGMRVKPLYCCLGFALVLIVFAAVRLEGKGRVHTGCSRRALQAIRSYWDASRNS